MSVPEILVDGAAFVNGVAVDVLEQGQAVPSGHPRVDLRHDGVPQSVPPLFVLSQTRCQCLRHISLLDSAEESGVQDRKGVAFAPNFQDSLSAHEGMEPGMMYH